MNDPYLRMFVCILSVSLACTLLLYGAFFVRLVQGRMEAEGIERLSFGEAFRAYRETELPFRCGKLWLFLLLFWSIFCLLSAWVALSQWKGRQEARLEGDLWSVLVGLSFFYIGMIIRHLLWKKKRNATACAQATVVSVEAGRGMDQTIVYRPVYKFYAEGVMHRVVSPTGHNTSPLKAGERVKLYYIPGQPEKIIVPQEQRMIRRISILFCILGMLCPVTGLLAPWLRLL